MNYKNLPDYVFVLEKPGDVLRMPFRKIKEHEETIIEDNMAFAFMHGESKKKINEYETQARREWKELKDKLRDNPNMILILDETTERYVPYVKNPNT